MNHRYPLLLKARPVARNRKSCRDAEIDAMPVDFCFLPLALESQPLGEALFTFFKSTVIIGVRADQK